jgi:hypothetical protein
MTTRHTQVMRTYPVKIVFMSRLPTFSAPE